MSWRLPPCKVLVISQNRQANLKFERILEEVKTRGLQRLLSYPPYATSAATTENRTCTCSKEEPPELESCASGICPLKRRILQLLERKGAATEDADTIVVPRHWTVLEHIAADLAQRGINFIQKSEVTRVECGVDTFSQCVELLM